MYNEMKAVDEIEVMRGESWGDGTRIIQSYGKPILRDQAVGYQVSVLGVVRSLRFSFGHQPSAPQGEVIGFNTILVYVSPPT